MAKRNRLQEEKEYADLMSVNEMTQVNETKKIISKLLPNDIKVVSKNESQKELIKSIKNNEITICAGPAGTGKAQPLDSLILSESGFIRMGDVKLNDMIYTMSGQLTKVIGIFPQGKKDVYEITFSDDSIVECCKEHLWLSKSIKDRKNKRDYKIRELSEMINDFLIEKDDSKNYSIPITKPIKINEKPIAINPYLMGILIGENYSTSSNNKIKIDDVDFINEFYKNLSQIDNLVNKYGLNITNHNERFIPNDYLFNSIENRIELLQGLMEYNCKSVNGGGKLIFLTLSSQLIQNFRFLIESLGGVVNKLCIKTNKTTNKTLYSYTYRLPNYIIPFKLKRNLEQFKPNPNNNPIRYITNITYVGEKQCQCIMVDAPSHTYLTNNFIVTHNTFVAIAYALSLLRKSDNRYKKIYLVKSVTTLKNEELGYLKGGLREKIDPFMWSFYINIEKVILKQILEALLNEEIIIPFPLAYMRGASLDDCIIVADECIGGDNKIIVTYDGNTKPKSIKAEKLTYYYNKYDNLKVLSHNDVTNKNEFKIINSIRITNNKETLNIKLQDNSQITIVSTNHPFAIIDNGLIKYIPANELKVGDRLLKRKNKIDNHELTSSPITEIKMGDNMIVYNMDVDGNNNYYVNNILTHNCQNITLDNARTLLTRIGSNSKIILLGDKNQIDLKFKSDSSLDNLLNIFSGIENIGVISMSDEDVNIRNPLINVIEAKFKEHYKISNNNNNNGK